MLALVDLKIRALERTWIKIVKDIAQYKKKYLYDERIKLVHYNDLYQRGEEIALKLNELKIKKKERSY